MFFIDVNTGNWLVINEEEQSELGFIYGAFVFYLEHIQNKLKELRENPEFALRVYLVNNYKSENMKIQIDRLFDVFRSSVRKIVNEL